MRLANTCRKFFTEISNSFQSKSFVFETVLLFLVEKDLIPINERTEGLVTVESGMVYITYKTCTQVGEDWNDDVWDEGTSEHSVNDLLVE